MASDATLPDLYPAERTVYNLLADGKPHTRRAIHRALGFDEQDHLSNIQPHLSRLRMKVRPLGEEIVCEIVSRRICYRRVVLLVPAAGT